MSTSNVSLLPHVRKLRSTIGGRMTSFEKIARLKQLLLGMEKDLGVDNLNSIQKNIVYAAALLSENSQTIETDEIRRHDLLEGVSRSSFFRALREVIDAGYLERGYGKQRSSFLLINKLK